MSALLIIFAKEPTPGQVKTRLTPPLSAEAAAALYQHFVADILEEMGRLKGLELALAYSPPGAHSFFQELVPAGTRLFTQEGADLGERLARALAWGFGAGFRPVLLRGSDSPDLPGSFLVEAREVLQAGRAQVVLGPCADGGYYLVGLKGPQPALFQDMAWSSATVLADTLDRARALSLTVHLLPAWEDIDTYGDLLRYLKRPHPAPAPGWRSDRLARELLLRRP